MRRDDENKLNNIIMPNQMNNKLVLKGVGINQSKGIPDDIA